jgi:hypothetical protein
MQSRRNVAVGMNSITVKNNIVVTLHLNEEECSGERLAPYGELHRDDTLGLHQVAPHAVKRKVSLHVLVILPSKLLQDGVHHQVDGSAAVNEHPRYWLPVDVTSNVQWLQMLAQLFGLFEHGLLEAKTHLSDLLLNAPEFGRQRECHVDVHAG